MMSLFAGSLHRRFVLRVLMPPLIMLLILSIIGLWQFDRLQRGQAIDELHRSAADTASKLDREFALRETVLRNTGSELFAIKSEYQANRSKLDADRQACRTYIKQTLTFKGAPNSVCDPFRGGFASASNLLVGVEDEYVRLSQQLIDEQNRQINEWLNAFKQLFPEALSLIIIDSAKQVVSSAQVDTTTDMDTPLRPDAEAALIHPILGKQTTVGKFRLSLFALPIQGGSVLVAYDTLNTSFIHQIWAATPIDRKKAIAAILDAQGNLVYPDFKDKDVFKGVDATLSKHSSADVNIGSITYTVVGARTTESDWTVVVASPTAVLASQVYDARFFGIVIVGLLVVSFAWIGTFFIRRTIRTITRLVSGAVIFGSGRLNYKIKLDNADEEFEQLAETMNAMAARISDDEHKIEEKNKEFISVTTHEIKTPLAIISGYLSLFHDMHSSRIKRVDAHANELVDQAYAATVRLNNMVSDMLNAARLESKQSKIVLAPTDLRQIIRDALSALRMVAGINNIQLKYHEANYVPVVGDVSILQIVLSNFVSNAIKYNRPGGHVIISHKQDNGQLVTAVADNGLGIPKDQQAHMFKKFFRVSNEDREHIAGTGLGMYVVKAYVEQMGGKVWFESVHGKGTTFYFSLPKSKATLPNKLKSHVFNLARKVVPARSKQQA